MDDVLVLPAWEEHRPRDRTVVVALSGSVDYLDAVTLKHRLADLASDGARLVVVDLRAAADVDRAVLPALLTAVRRLTLRGARLGVLAHAPAVVGMLDTVGLPCAPTVDDVIARAGGGRTG